MTTELIVNIALGISAVLAAAFALQKFIRPLLIKTRMLARNWERFLMDWAGEEARPGRDRVPGVMERLNKIDGELTHNGGSSIKDAISRIEKRLMEGDGKFDELSQRVSKLEDRLEE